MSKLVTQALESSVAVLVFARPSPLVRDIEKNLHTKHIEAIVVDPSEILEEELSQLEQQSFYKICWIFDDTCKGTSQADSIFSFLFAREEPVVILTNTLSRNEDHHGWKEKHLADDELLEHLQKYLPKAAVVVAENLMDLPELFVSPLYFLAEEDVSDFSGPYTCAEDSSQKLESILLRPHHAGIQYVPSQKKLTAKQKKELFDQIPRDEPIIEPVPEFQLTHTPPIQQQRAEYETDFITYNRPEVRIYPHVQPKIVNRQQLYEQNIHKIKHRHQRKQLLRPVAHREKRKSEESLPPVAFAATVLKPVEQHLELTIQQLFGSQRSEHRETRLQTKALKTVVTKKKQVRQRVVMKLLAAAVVFLVLSGGVIGSFFGLRSYIFHLIVNESNAQTLAKSSPLYSRFNKALLTTLSTEVYAYQFFAGPDVMAETAAVISAIHQLETLHKLQEDLRTKIIIAISQVLGKSDGDVFETLSDVSSQQQNLYSSLSVIQTQLQALPTEFLKEDEQKAVELILNEIQFSRRQLATFEQVQQLLPAFLAKEGKRRIALVLLDSQELRPAGGTLQGIYVLTLEKGEIIDKEFYDPAALEKKLPGRFQAPADFKKLMNREELSLIDSTWSPDFTETAGTLSLYLDQAIGRKPDVVLSLTTQTLKELLSQTGEIELPQEKETITDKNIRERLETNAEPAYLQHLFSALIDRALSDPEIALKTLTTIGGELQNGQVAVVSSELTENDVLNSLGWAGQVSTPQCPSLLSSEHCTVSTLYQVESNIGLTKVGALIRRSIQHAITLQKEQIHHRRVMTFTNQANTSRWPLGAYRNYLRLYVSNNVRLTSVQVGDKAIDLREVERGETKSGQYLGFVVDVPPQATVTAVVEYTEPFSYQAGAAFAFFDQKQAGTVPEDYTVTLLPEEMQAAVIAPKARLEGGKIIFTQPRERHQFVGIKFR